MWLNNVWWGQWGGQWLCGSAVIVFIPTQIVNMTVPIGLAYSLTPEIVVISSQLVGVMGSVAISAYISQEE